MSNQSAERDEINAASMDRSAGRWCDRCEQHGSHHTERHDEFLARARSVVIPPAETAIERCRRLHGLEPGYVMGCDECEVVTSPGASS